MENASKALIMAGSILMAMLVIGALVFMYNQITGIEQTKTDNDELSKITDYTNKFESYNKSNIYGSELLSLANLQEDYSKKKDELVNYTNINIYVNLSREITDYFNIGQNNIKNIKEIINDIEKDISNYENKGNFKGKTVKYYSQMTNKQIASIYGIQFDNTLPDYDVGEILEQEGGEVAKLLRSIEDYKTLKTIYTEFKNKKFKCTKMEYDLNGRVNYMLFEEK